MADVPSLAEIDGVESAEVDRQTDVAEAYGDQDPTIGGVTCLATHPSGPDRVLRPDDEHSRGASQLFGDLAVELLAGRDVRVPPHGPALALERGNQSGNASLVVARIGDEDVGHAAGLPPLRVARPLRSALA